MRNNVKVIGFDADDTLWVNEPYFREAEEEFCGIFTDTYSKQKVMDTLFTTEINNLCKYGYGSKACMLSMMETLIKLNGQQYTHDNIRHILEIGNKLLTAPREPIEHVEATLQKLLNDYKLILVTKGDLLEQELKLERSGLQKYFDHIEILSEKNTYNYKVLLNKIGTPADEFLMVGNSLKSDILPAVEQGCYGVYIPFHITWKHEQVDISTIDTSKFIQLDNIKDLISVLYEKNN